MDDDYVVHSRDYLQYVLAPIETSIAATMRLDLNPGKYYIITRGLPEISSEYEEGPHPRSRRNKQ